MITKFSGDDVHFWDTVRQTIPGSRITMSGGGEQGLSLEDWERIGDVTSFPKNHKLVSADEVPKCLYIVKKGFVAGYEELVNGNELIYYLMDRNAMFMEANLLLARPAMVNFRTLEPSELICVRKEVLIKALEEDRRVFFSMFSSVSNKFLVAMEELRGSRGHSAEWMLCHLLLEFAERYGVAYDGQILISKNVSFQMLAGLLGVNRATAVRAMHSLRDLGLIERINGFLCVRSTEALKRHQELLEG